MKEIQVILTEKCGSDERCTEQCGTKHPRVNSLVTTNPAVVGKTSSSVSPHKRKPVTFHCKWPLESCLHRNLCCRGSFPIFISSACSHWLFQGQEASSNKIRHLTKRTFSVHLQGFVELLKFLLGWLGSFVFDGTERQRYLFNLSKH